MQLDLDGWPVDWTTVPESRDQAALCVLAAACGHRPDITGTVEVLVYSSEDLDDLVLRKLSQPVDNRLPEHLRGLGYSDIDAERVYSEVLRDLDASGRSFLITPAPGELPLPGADYDERCIWGLFRAAMDDRPDADPILVTHDRTFGLLVTACAPLNSEGQPLCSAMSALRFCQTLASF